MTWECANRCSLTSWTIIINGKIFHKWFSEQCTSFLYFIFTAVQLWEPPLIWCKRFLKKRKWYILPVCSSQDKNTGFTGEVKKIFLSGEKEDEAQEVDYLSRLWISPTWKLFMVMWDWHNQVKLIFMRAGLSDPFHPGKTIWIHWAFFSCILYGIL